MIISREMLEHHQRQHFLTQHLFADRRLSVTSYGCMAENSLSKYTCGSSHASQTYEETYNIFVGLDFFVKLCMDIAEQSFGPTVMKALSYNDLTGCQLNNVIQMAKGEDSHYILIYKTSTLANKFILAILKSSNCAT